MSSRRRACCEAFRCLAVLVFAPLILLGGCADGGNEAAWDPSVDAGLVELEVGVPRDAGIGVVVVGVEVRAGGRAAPAIASEDYDAVAAALRVVLQCDARPGNQPNTVTLSVVAAYADSSDSDQALEFVPAEPVQRVFDCVRSGAGGDAKLAVEMPSVEVQ